MQETLSSTKIGGHSAQDFLTKSQLAERLNLKSVRMVEELMRKRKIPFTRLGHRTIRFSWAEVQRALGHLEVKAFGADGKKNIRHRE